MKRKTVWLINQYLTTPELNGSSHRHSSLSDEWKKKGYDVLLITSSYSHTDKRNNKFNGLFSINNENIKTLLIKGNVYSNPNGVFRIISWLIFSFFLFFIPIKKLPKPDIIIVSSISLLPILNVVFYFKKKFKKVKFILEIRDIWPLSLIEIGNYSPKNIFIRTLSWVEKLGYKKADHIVSLLVNADNHIKSVLGNDDFQFTWISNGYNLEKETYYKPLPQSITNKIPSNKFIIGYAGALGNANGMETIIDVMNSFHDENIVLCLIGDGSQKENLILKANKNPNILFLGSVKKDEVYSFLEKCDLLFFSSKNLKIYKFGISANKTFDYMNAGKPIVLSAPTKGNAIELANCGSVIPAENVTVLRQEILKYTSMTPQERETLGANGKSYLLNHYTYKVLANRYIDVFEHVLLN